MKHRIATQIEAWNSSAAGTRIIELNMVNPISRIVVQMKGTNADNAAVGHPALMVTKIEVVDGSDVLFALSGTECQALNYYDQGKMPHNVVNYILPAKAIATYHIDFGRHLWDEQSALVPNKFKNLQLKITYDDGLGGCATTASTISVFAYLFDAETISPRGFLMAKEQYKYTQNAAGLAHEYIQLPTDFDIRKLLIQSLVADKQPWEQYNRIKISEDNDRRIPVNNLRTSDLLKLYQADRRIQEDLMVELVSTPDTYYCAATYDTVATGVGMVATDAAIANVQSYGGTIGIIGTNAQQHEWHITGLAPHGVLCIPFGEQDKIEDWYTVAPINELLLDITQGTGTTGTTQICTQQFRTY